MSEVIYVTKKRPVTENYVPSGLNDGLPVIRKLEVIKRTTKGFRLRVSHAPEKGTMFLDDHNFFFYTYADALEFVASEANRVAGELEERKQQAVRLMCEAHDELRNHKTGGAA
ncbi:TPA: hypothetical protein ACS62H_004680 [Klebsiella pneumoniae]